MLLQTFIYCLQCIRNCSMLFLENTSMECIAFMNVNKISTIEPVSLEMPEYMIAALLRSYLSHMDENEALKKLSEIVKPEVIGIRPLEPVHTNINYEKLGALIREAAENVASEQIRSDNLSDYDPQLKSEEDRLVNDTKATIIAFLQNMDVNQHMSQITAEFAEYITKCYYVLRF